MPIRANSWPENFDFTHYAYVWAKIDTLPTNLFNSVYVTLATVAIASICSILAGYALVHLEFRGRAIVIIVLTATLSFPTGVVFTDCHLLHSGRGQPARHHHQLDPALCHAQSGDQHSDHPRHLRANATNWSMPPKWMAAMPGKR